MEQFSRESNYKSNSVSTFPPSSTAGLEIGQRRTIISNLNNPFSLEARFKSSEKSSPHIAEFFTESSGFHCRGLADSLNVYG